MYADLAQKQSKSEKIEEWKSLPLGNDKQRKAWVVQKRNAIEPPRSSCSSDQPSAGTRDHQAVMTAQLEVLQSIEAVAAPAQAPQHAPVFMANQLSLLPKQQAIVNCGEPAGSVVDVFGITRSSGTSSMASTSSQLTAAMEEFRAPLSQRPSVDRWRKYF